MRIMPMYSVTPEILPFRSPMRQRLLTMSEVQSLQEGTLWLLGEVGVHFPSETALHIFADHGAAVDFETQIVRLPPDLVRRAMSRAPSQFVLGGREPRFDLPLDRQASYLSTDGCGVHVVDLETCQQRPSRKADVAMMARVCDALPLIGFFWPLVSAQDCAETARLHEAHAGLTNTLKHVRGGSTMHPALAPYLVEMATVVAGDEATRRRRPAVCANICTIAPLAQDKHGIETALVFAEAGIPTSFMAMPTMGSTAPATPLGAIVQGDAEVISAMTLIQLAYPGAPVFHSIFVSLMDPHTGGYISHYPLPVEWMTVELGHAWGIPTLGGGSLSSDEAASGWGSGVQGGLGAGQIPLMAGDVCGFLGMLGGSMILYPEQVILDHEICMKALDLFGPFEFREADMALDVIRAVGPRSHYLRQPHTRRHIRDFRLSPLLRQADARGEASEPREVAREEFRRLLRDHQPQPLPEAQARELDRIMKAADRQALEIVP
jgi:trimethylamine--corrinoid protein Co-methyltransferase